MKKAAALTLAGLMAVTSANASMSRRGGFGESAKFVSDVQDMWTLPEVVASNADSTYFEFGKINTTRPSVSGSDGFSGYAVAANAWGGNHEKLGPGVLSLWYNRPFTANQNVNMGTSSAGALSSAFTLPSAGVAGAVSSLTLNTPINQIDATYAWDMGAATLGVGINYASNSNKTESTTSAGTDVSQQNSSNFGLSLGAGFKDLGALKSLDAGLQYNGTSSQVAGKDAGSTYDDKITFSGTEIDLRVSGDLGEKNKGNLIDLVVVSQNVGIKAEPKTAAPANSYSESKLSYMDVNLGWAMSMSNDKGMGLGGFILDWNSNSRDQANVTLAQQADKVDASNLAIKAVGGGEAKAKDWLTLRLALTGTLFQSSSTTIDQSPNGGTNKVTVTSSKPTTPAAITVGSSIMLGDIVIDGVANQDMFFSGPYLVSGVPAGLSTQVSATWGWGGSKE